MVIFAYELFIFLGVHIFFEVGVKVSSNVKFGNGVFVERDLPSISGVFEDDDVWYDGICDALCEERCGFWVELSNNLDVLFDGFEGFSCFFFEFFDVSVGDIFEVIEEDEECGVE